LSITVSFVSEERGDRLIGVLTALAAHALKI